LVFEQVKLAGLLSESKAENPSTPKRLRRVLVDKTLAIHPPFHVPQPAFGALTSITPYEEDEAFHHPVTLNPEIAKATYLKAGLRLQYSPEALKIIRDHRSVTFEYDTTGYVWVKSSQDDTLRAMVDQRSYKTFLTWSAYYDAYRLRQAGSVLAAKEAFEDQGIRVTLKNFPSTSTKVNHIKPPSGFNVELYPFQKRAVQFVLKNEGRACIFDEMGLGKTVSATAALIELVRRKKAARAIVVAPNAVLEQWRDEMTQKFKLQPTLVTSKKQWNERSDLYNDPLIITNYELLRTDIETILKSGFDTVILDEVTRVKNWDTQTSEAVKKLFVKNVIALTGTPLENHVGELYNVVNLVKPGFFGRYNEDFLAHYTVKDQQGWQSARPTVNPATVHELRKRLNQISIRRTKNQVFKQLPTLTTQYIYTEPARNQKMIYDILQESLGETILEEEAFSSEKIEGPNPFTGNRLRLYTLLREACADISMIAGYLRRKQRENTNESFRLQETQVFRKLVQILPDLENENAKLTELKELAKDLIEQGHKIVIFSQFVPVVNLIQEELSNDGIPTLIYTGQLSHDERSANLRSFIDQENFRALASTDAGQFGLNLQVADVVINYDLPWNPARLQQRIARLHRIGQANKVLAVNFVVKGTIEEHVRDILERKKKTFRDITVSEISPGEQFTLEELRELFGLDMRGLAKKIHDRYGLRVEPSSKELKKKITQ
jgi:SNF2 family DNA or RNA helicase